jgi:hypothetical protein
MLEGTLESWDKAVTLLNDLLQVVPRPLYCIISGFQLLDDPSTDGYADHLVKTLHSAVMTISQATGSLKVLIKTTGRSRSLMRNLERREIVLADRDGAVNSSARQGGQGRFIL